MDFERFDMVGPLTIQPLRRGDARGYFAEIFRVDRFVQEVGSIEFVQENESYSVKAGTVRGLHFQSDPFAQGKLVRCVAGSLLDVAVDIRVGSPTFGKWVSRELSAVNGCQLWIPPGFAHGFCTLEPNTIIVYKVTSYYSAENDHGIAWDDPVIGVRWPAAADPQTLSLKDQGQPPLADLPAYFKYRA